jgi:hypothetical protein
VRWRSLPVQLLLLLLKVMRMMTLVFQRSLMCYQMVLSVKLDSLHCLLTRQVQSQALMRLVSAWLGLGPGACPCAG